ASRRARGHPERQMVVHSLSGRGVYGRLVQLQPVRWQDGRPVIGQPAENDGVGEPVSDHVMPALAAASADVPQTSDEFAAPQLGLQWQWQANHRDDWLSLRPAPAGCDCLRRPVRIPA
ncbi:MAG TPA: hypothetical protein VFV96_09025, partial [Verrucomicrobiae bacterium]|nr:hypothetical protein [Verrucomicrobiae bacterium]